jgi:ParB family chromosome partitioning protein
MTKKFPPLSTPVGVKEVPINKLVANPHNPRYLFDRRPMDALFESIQKAGILVPLTVYQEKASGQFIILDGQRRWMCAQKVGLKTVPVNQVAEPDLVQNIVTMFQIHKLREDWELMPSALKIELLMNEINDRNDARIAELTGLNESVIIRCKKLLSYDRNFQDMMLTEQPEQRLKSDFFIELYPVIHDRDVVTFPWFSKNKFIRSMLAKYLEEPRTIKSVTDFRLVKQHITNARRIKALPELSRRLQKFFSAHATPLSHLAIEAAGVHAKAKSLARKVSVLEEAIDELDTEQFYGEEELWQSLVKLHATVEKKLKNADKRR